jgi:hypothetical protein
MKHYNITIVSKNKKALVAFFLFFGGNLDLNFNTINKYFERKKRRKILTILKSPHVNKKAQEQFESKLFSKQLTLYLPNHFQYLLFLKKIKTIFTEVRVKIKFIHNKNLLKKKQMYIFNIQNFKLELLNDKTNRGSCRPKKISLAQRYTNIAQKEGKISTYDKARPDISQQIKQYIEIADIYGELCLT